MLERAGEPRQRLGGLRGELVGVLPLEVPRLVDGALVVSVQRDEQGVFHAARRSVEHVDDVVDVRPEIGHKRLQLLPGEPRPAFELSVPEDVEFGVRVAKEHQQEGVGLDRNDALADAPADLLAVVDCVVDLPPDLPGRLEPAPQHELAERRDDGDESEVGGDQREQQKQHRCLRTERHQPGADEPGQQSGQQEKLNYRNEHPVATHQQPLPGVVLEQLEFEGQPCPPVTRIVLPGHRRRPVLPRRHIPAWFTPTPENVRWSATRPPGKQRL